MMVTAITTRKEVESREEWRSSDRPVPAQGSAEPAWPQQIRVALAFLPSQLHLAEMGLQFVAFFPHIALSDSLYA